MNPLKTAMSGLLLICFFGVLAAAEFPDNDTQVDDSTATEPLSGSWQKNLTTSGIQHDNSVGHSKAGFVRHTIGDDTRLLSYEIYLIADPHIGGVAAYPDYNKPGYSPLLDFDWRDGEGKDRMGGPNGSYPGRFLNYAVQLINEHFDYADGVSRYCVVLGDLTNTAERAEFQHAKIKLDSLDCPWVPIIGNHDTWPRASDDSKQDDDRYLEQIFKSQFGIDYNSHAKEAFPIWVRAQFPSTPGDEPHWYNWCFRWGPHHHQGLDWVKRSYGGSAWTAKDYHESGWAPHGTYHWFNANTAYHSNYTNNLMIYAHHPLSHTVNPLNFPYQQFSAAERTRITEVVDDNYEWAMTHWFCGHAHKEGKGSHTWAVGLDGAGSDTVIKVHFFPGVYGEEAPDDGEKQYYVGNIKVYDDYKCNFSWQHPSSQSDFVNVGDEVAYLDDCECYYSWPVTTYLWEFGDGSLSYSSAPIHTFNSVKKFYTKLNAQFSSGQNTYCSKPILVGFHYPQWSMIRFYKYTSSSGINSYMTSYPTTWKAYLRWWTKRYKWEFDKFEVYRKRQYESDYSMVYETTDRNDDDWASNDCEDSGPFYSEQWVYFKILGKWHKHDYSELPGGPYSPEDFWGHDTLVQVPEDPDPPPKCPEAYTCIGYDSTSGGFEFAPNNTVLAHSPTNPAMAKDLLLLDWPLYEYQGFTAITLMERSTETSVFDGIKLHAVDHPKGTGIVTSSDSNVYCVKNVAEPWACFDAFENDYLYNVLPHTGSENSLKAVAGQEIFVKFDFPCWGDGSGLLMSSGLEPEEDYIDPKRNKICAFQEDTSGNWIPIGEAYTRGYPSEWLMKAVEDTGAAMLPSFKLQFAGEDTACINYIMLVSLVDSGWTDTTVSPTMALHWYQVGGPGGGWESTNKTAELLLVDDTTCVLEPSEQLAVVFPAVPANPDTSMVRDYVLESYGVYTSGAIPPGSPGVEEKEPVFTYAFNVKQMRPFSRTATISYQVPRSTHVSLALYDVSGRLVRSFVDEKITRGKYTISWDGTDSKGAKVSSGAYFVRIKAESFLKTQKLVILE